MGAIEDKFPVTGLDFKNRLGDCYRGKAPHPIRNGLLY